MVCFSGRNLMSDWVSGSTNQNTYDDDDITNYGKEVVIEATLYIF